MTQGTGTFGITPDGYRQVLADVENEILSGQRPVKLEGSPTLFGEPSFLLRFSWTSIFFRIVGEKRFVRFAVTATALPIRFTLLLRSH